MYVHVNIPFSAIFLSLAQAGIVSFGTLSCGNDDPTVYTRVDAYLDWIEEKLREWDRTLHSSLIMHMYRVFESFEDNAAREEQLDPACPIV